MNVTKVAFLIVMLTLGEEAVATHHICWVENVNAVDGVVRVVMRQGYEFAPRGVIAHDGSRIELKKNTDGSFDLAEGNTVFLSTLPHDSCVGKSVKRGSVLGLQLEAANCSPGTGCVTAKDFVSGE